LVLGLGGRVWCCLFGGHSISGSVSVSSSLAFFSRLRLSCIFSKDSQDCSSDLTISHVPHLSCLLHLLFLYGIGNQNIVISMTIFDPSVFKNLRHTIFDNLGHT
jgi:hypothetical protein